MAIVKIWRGEAKIVMRIRRSVATVYPGSEQRYHIATAVAVRLELIVEAATHRFLKV